MWSLDLALSNAVSPSYDGEGGERRAKVEAAATEGRGRGLGGAERGGAAGSGSHKMPQLYVLFGK